jgi:hypothetical protein
MCKECEVLTPQEVIEKFDNRLAEMIGAVDETAVDGMMDRVNQAKYDVLSVGARRPLPLGWG